MTLIFVFCSYPCVKKDFVVIKHPYILLIRVHYFSQEGRESVFPKLGEVNSVIYEYEYISLYMKLIVHSDSVKLENKIDCFCTTL